MIISAILFPMIAFVLAVVVGRIGTIIMDDLRSNQEMTGHALMEMDNPHEQSNTASTLAAKHS